VSFDIFLQCFRNREPTTFPRGLFEEIFARHAIAPRFPLDEVTYGDGGAAIYGGDDDDIQGLMFNHCGGETFFSALYQLAQRTGSVVFWPDTAPSTAVTDAGTIAHLPEGFDRLGPPYVARSGCDLADYISRPT